MARTESWAGASGQWRGAGCAAAARGSGSLGAATGAHAPPEGRPWRPRGRAAGHGAGWIACQRRGASAPEQPLTKPMPGVGTAAQPTGEAHSVGLYFLIISITPAGQRSVRGAVAPASHAVELVPSADGEHCAAAASPAADLTSVGDHGGHRAELGERGALGGCCGGHCCRDARILSAALATGGAASAVFGVPLAEPPQRGCATAAPDTRGSPRTESRARMSRSVSRRLRALHAPMRAVDTSGEPRAGTARTIASGAAPKSRPARSASPPALYGGARPPSQPPPRLAAESTRLRAARAPLRPSAQTWPRWPPAWCGSRTALCGSGRRTSAPRSAPQPPAAACGRGPWTRTWRRRAAPRPRAAGAPRCGCPGC